MKWPGDHSQASETHPHRELPDRWQVRRLKYAADVNPSTPIPQIEAEAETLVSFVPMEAVGEYGGLDLSIARAPSELGSGYTRFRDGDVLVAKITPCFENGKGAIARDLVNGVGFGTTELHVLRPHPGVDPRYLFYLTTSASFRDTGEGAMYGAGGQKRVSTEFVREFRGAFPPHEHQRAIGEFLDRNTTAIDDLIRKHEQLIELLKERKLSLITQAVTGGIELHEAATG